MLYILIGLSIAWVSFWVGKHWRDLQLIRMLGDEEEYSEALESTLEAAELLLHNARPYLEASPLTGVMDYVDMVDAYFEARAQDDWRTGCTCGGVPCTAQRFGDDCSGEVKD